MSFFVCSLCRRALASEDAAQLVGGGYACARCLRGESEVMRCEACRGNGACRACDGSGFCAECSVETCDEVRIGGGCYECGYLATCPECADVRAGTCPACHGRRYVPPPAPPSVAGPLQASLAGVL